MKKSEINITDLRTGNVLSYTTAEGDDLDTAVDWQDLKWLEEDPKGFNLAHKPIPLSDDVLVKLSFKKVSDSQKWVKDDIVWSKEYLQLNKWYKNAFDAYFMLPGFKHTAVSFNSRPIKYVHQLQNLYFSLTGEELELER